MGIQGTRGEKSKRKELGYYGTNKTLGYMATVITGLGRTNIQRVRLRTRVGMRMRRKTKVGKKVGNRDKS